MSSIRAAIGVTVILATTALSAPLASGAEFGIAPGSLTVETIDAEGNPDSRAGAHPDRLRVAFDLLTNDTGTTARDMVFEISPGLASRVGVVPECSRLDFDRQGENTCPPETQVGALVQELLSGEALEMPLYSLEPLGEAAAFGAKPFWGVPMKASLRPEDYGLVLGANELVQFPLGSGHIELWGVPADHQNGTGIPRKPFLTTPTQCAPLTVTMHVRSWLVGAPWQSESAETAPFEDCESLPFDPKLDVSLTDTAVDAPTGARIDFTMSEDEDPDGRASSQIEDILVELPPGIGVAPGGVAGKRPCTDAKFGLNEEGEPDCPQSSVIGSVDLESPLSRTAMVGNLYLGEERPGERIRMLIAASAPGVVVKLTGSLHTDPETGRLSTKLTQLPQLPFGRISLNMAGGPQALLATPLTCGQTVVTGRFEPYSGNAPVNSSVPISVGGNGPCPRATPFAPEFMAGSSNRRPGSAATFSMTMRRADGEQLPGRLTVALPPGLNGAFGTVERCSRDAAAAGSCADASKIGHAVAEVGSGPSPAAIQGSVYLTESYRRAPFGLAIVFPAQIGPFDLGTIVTRGAVELDRHTAQVTVRTDPLPEVVDGIPIRFRTLGIDIDRPGLIRNPTSCAPTSIRTTIDSVQGAAAASASPFALRGCSRLGFRPRFAIALTGGNELRRRGRPGLSIVARPRPRDTHIQAMRVSLPRMLTFETARLREICSRPDANSGLCSNRARVGTAFARTPLLDEPLKGAIYVVQPEADGLPGLSLDLEAGGVEVGIRGVTTRENGRFATEMVGLPDMPLSNLRMRFGSGRHSIFSLQEEPCAGRGDRLVVPIAVTGHDGAFRRMRSPVATRPACAGTSRAKGDRR